MTNMARLLTAVVKGWTEGSGEAGRSPEAMNGALKGWPMNGVYKILQEWRCVCCCALAPDGSHCYGRLIRLGTRADKSTDVRTRASVNDLAGLVAVGDRVGVYGVVTDRTDASYAALTAEWDAAPR